MLKIIYTFDNMYCPYITYVPEEVFNKVEFEQKNQVTILDIEIILSEEDDPYNFLEQYY